MCGLSRLALTFSHIPGKIKARSLSFWLMLFSSPLLETVLNPIEITTFKDVEGTPYLCHPSSVLAAYPVQHGPFLRDAQLVRLLPCEADLLQRVPGGSVRGHISRIVL